MNQSKIMKHKGIEKFGNTIFDYDECANWDTECPRDCDFHGCMSYRPKKYEATF